ncbi:uncharacterized protein [Malus domestica]|uniref:uncharacterized protein n=1 Tax=Malus domestica TaxID=3750 RepID=UPI003976C094
MKIELFCFSGDNPYSWLVLAEEYMDYHGVEPHNRITMEGLYFTDDAALWFKWYKLHVGWTDAQLLGVFLDGLKMDLKDDVLALGPRSLARTIDLTRIYDNKQQQRRTSFSSYSSRPSHEVPAASSMVVVSHTKPHLSSPAQLPLHLSPAEVHVAAVSEVTSDLILEDTPPVSDEPLLDETVPIALNTLVSPKRTQWRVMHLVGYSYTLPIWVFIDSGVDFNFLSPSIAMHLGLRIDHSLVEQVVVANGSICYTQGIAYNFTMTLYDYTFSSDIRLLAVRGCNLFLEAEWLETLGFIGWHFKHKVMEFQIKGHNYRLVGLHSSDSPPHLPSSPSASSRPHIESLLASLLSASSPPEAVHPIHPSLISLLDSYSDLFVAPTGLPPHQEFDHIITLLLGTYLSMSVLTTTPMFKKTEMEKQVDEMLAACLIRPSSSPFSSPALLVHKVDLTWCFCVDYRGLNQVTVKFSFPVPIIDELLDELRGAKIVSKLNLQYGFHQIRMYEPDIPKTDFRTHDGHFEFLVMLFGLCNAPSTFQTLMNSIFKPFLRKFVLVFFDDILIFSPNLPTHLYNITFVFDVLRAHALKVK